jgi:hypothetical protein
MGNAAGSRIMTGHLSPGTLPIEKEPFVVSRLFIYNKSPAQ